MKRDEGGLRSFDDLATGLETGAISRGNALKLTGAALAASALGLFASRADAQDVMADDVNVAVKKRRCRQQGGDFCRESGCTACCGRGGRRRKACCGRRGCRCCRRNQNCRPNGQCD